jgi:hypothetical protein
MACAGAARIACATLPVTDIDVAMMSHAQKNRAATRLSRPVVSRNTELLSVVTIVGTSVGPPNRTGGALIHAINVPSGLPIVAGARLRARPRPALRFGP